MTALPRRRLLAAGAAVLTLVPQARAAGAAVRLVSPPGSLLGLADYPYWIAKTFGYFGDLDTSLSPGPPDAMAGIKPVDRGAFDLGVAEAGLFALGLEQDMRLVSVWQIQPTDPLALAFRKGEAPTGLRALSGKTLLLDSMARTPACDAWFAQAGLEPDAVTCLDAGPAWGRTLAQGKGDAALAWEGLRAEWAAQGFDYLQGRAVSRFPGRCLVMRATDLADPDIRPRAERYLRGWAMGLVFAERNPRGAAAIVARQSPALAAAMPAAVATAALMQLARSFRGDMDRRKGWGWHDADAWALLLRTLRQIGQISAPIGPDTAVSNAFIAAANDFDAGKVKADADGFALPPDFAQVDVDAIRAAL